MIDTMIFWWPKISNDTIYMNQVPSHEVDLNHESNNLVYK